MADENKLIVEIELDDGSIKKGFITLEKQGKDTADNLSKSFSSGLGFKALAVGAAVAAAGVAFLAKSIKEAAEAEVSVNKLNTALKLTGKFSEEASRNIQNFASNIQKTTTFSDDFTLQTAALIQNLANLDEQGLKRATKASLDFATATGKDATTAATLLAKAANGNIETFSRYGIAVKKGATDTETFNNALKAIETRFGGSSEAAVNTFTGATQNLTNNFGELFEEFGKVIIQSPALITLIKGLSDSFGDLGKNLLRNFNVGEFNENLRNAIFLSAALGKVFTDFVFPPIELVFNLLKAGLIQIKNIGDILFFSLGEGFIAFAQALSGDFKGAGKTFTRLKESIKVDIEEIKSAASDETLFDFTFSDSTSKFIDGITNKFTEATNAADKLKNKMPEIKEEAEKLTVSGAFDAFGAGFDAEMMKIANSAKTGFEQVGASAVKGLGQAAGSAFAAFGKALAKGENGIKAFGEAFLASVGQIAIQLGTQFILTGIAYTYAGWANGPALIAAGAALAAFGGVLSAVGGGSESGAVGAGSEAGVIGPDTETGAPDLIDQGPTNEITINVDNSIVDADLPTRIAGLVQEAIDRNGTSILQVT